LSSANKTLPNSAHSLSSEYTTPKPFVGLTTGRQIIHDSGDDTIIWGFLRRMPSSRAKAG
jgi:hypothetical protein